MKVVILMGFLVAGAWASVKDPSDGLGCKIESGFKYCEGKSETYNKLAKDAQYGSSGEGLDTRSRGRDSHMDKHYGMPSRNNNYCDQGPSLGKCQLLSASILPTYLVNSQNKARYILQLGAFQQPIQMALCKGTSKVCGQYGFCEQNYINVELLAWDPLEKHPTLLVETFRIPSCCQCKRGGSRQGPRGWN